MVVSLDVEPGVSGYMNLTTYQRDTVQTAERVGATLSLVGVSFVAITFLLYKRMRTVTNTFIFFASIANVGASIACLIGYSGIAAGDTSALCQTQAFLLEMFMQSDPMWSFAMAVNVYLIFFTRYDPDMALNKMWLFCLVSFGLPAIPAVFCLLYKPHGLHIYGNATLWCWISDKYNPLRIYTYYLPIWLCTLGSTIIYIMLGYHVFLCRDELRNLTMSSQVHEFSNSEVRDSADKSIVGGQTGTYGTVTTEVQVTTTGECSSENNGQTTRPPTPAPSIAPVLPPTSQQAPWSSSCSDEITTVSSPTMTTTSTTQGCTPTATATTTTSTTAPTLPYTTISSSHSKHHNTRHNPPSTNPRKRTTTTTLRRKTIRLLRKLGRMYANIDPIKRAYLRTSFIFAVSVLVTWTPSSINRVYTLIYPRSTNYPLNLASAIVLPLQGVWNVLIYVITSWDGLSEEFCRLFGLPSPREEWFRRERAKYLACHGGEGGMNGRVVGGGGGGGDMDLEAGLRGGKGNTTGGEMGRGREREGGSFSGGGRKASVVGRARGGEDHDSLDGLEVEREEAARLSIGGGEMPMGLRGQGGGGLQRDGVPKKPMRILAKGYYL